LPCCLRFRRFSDSGTRIDPFPDNSVGTPRTFSCRSGATPASKIPSIFSLASIHPLGMDGLPTLLLGTSSGFRPIGCICWHARCRWFGRSIGWTSLRVLDSPSEKRHLRIRRRAQLSIAPADQKVATTPANRPVAATTVSRSTSPPWFNARQGSLIRPTRQLVPRFPYIVAAR